MVIPIPLIRKKHIVKRLKRCGAVSESTAKTLTEAGVINPDAFVRVTEKLLRDHIIVKTADDQYYLA